MSARTRLLSRSRSECFFADDRPPAAIAAPSGRRRPRLAASLQDAAAPPGGGALAPPMRVLRGSSAIPHAERCRVSMSGRGGDGAGEGCADTQGRDAPEQVRGFGVVDEVAGATAGSKRRATLGEGWVTPTRAPGPPTRSAGRTNGPLQRLSRCGGRPLVDPTRTRKLGRLRVEPSRGPARLTSGLRFSEPRAASGE